MNRRDDSEAGTILINVLMIVALASAVVMLLIDSQEDAVDRTTTFSEAARAAAIARGGIISAQAALRRDAKDSPGTDNPGEAWAKIQDRDRAIDGGRFSLAITDATSRFNINALADPDMASIGLFARILDAAGLAPEVGIRIAALLQVTGPISGLGTLRDAGLDDRQIAALAPLVTALPMRSTVNINTADQRLIAALTGNAAASAILVGVRSRKGYVDAEDVKSVKLILPPSLRFTSDAFWATSDVTIGDTSQHLVALLDRRLASKGIRVDPVGIWWGRSDPQVALATP